jgi:hypothetical protein
MTRPADGTRIKVRANIQSPQFSASPQCQKQAPLTSVVSLIKTRLEQKSYDATPSLKPATGTQTVALTTFPCMAVEGGGTVLLLAES